MRNTFPMGKKNNYHIKWKVSEASETLISLNNENQRYIYSTSDLNLVARVICNVGGDKCKPLL